MSLIPATGPERVLWFVLIILVVGYLVGVWRNRQRSKALGMWLQAGLGKLGGRVAWRWIRSMTSGAEVNVAETRPPFRQLQISYFLLTREFIPLWGIERLRGKRDLLAVRADLRSPPTQDLTIVPRHGKLSEELDKAAEAAPWHWTELPAGLGLATRVAPERALVKRVEAFVNEYGASIERLSLRRQAPHLIAFFKLAGMEKRPITELWAAFGKLLPHANN